MNLLLALGVIVVLLGIWVALDIRARREKQ